MPYENLENNQLLTPIEVSTLLGVKTATVYAWISRKEIRSVKIDGRRFVPMLGIHEMFARRRTGEYVDQTYANGPSR
jgi:excisionase family DNA binding protein